MRALAKVFCPLETGSRWIDLALTLPRVSAGVILAAHFGLGKLPVPPWFIEEVANLGFPYPALFAWLAVVSEVAGGLLLALGLATRPAALSIVCTMLTAALLQEAGDPLRERLPSLFFLAVAWYSLLLGSGRFGLDAWIGRRLWVKEGLGE